MNENTTELLKQLAQKMGTTTEYLWGVLLRQAPIDATISLVLLILTVPVGWLLWRIHIKIESSTPDDVFSDKGYNGVIQPVVMLIMGIGYILFAIRSIFDIQNIITGYFNPEYWALHEILNALK